MMSSKKLLLNNNSELSSDNGTSDDNNSTVTSTNLNDSTDSEKDSNHQDINPSRAPQVDTSSGKTVEQHGIQQSTQQQSGIANSPEQLYNTHISPFMDKQFKPVFSTIEKKQQALDARISTLDVRLSTINQMLSQQQLTFSTIIDKIKILTQQFQILTNNQIQPAMSNDSTSQFTNEPLGIESNPASNMANKSTSVTKSDIIDNFEGMASSTDDLDYRRMTKNIAETYHLLIENYPEYKKLKFYHQKDWHILDIPAGVSLLPKTVITIQDNLTNKLFKSLEGKKSQDINPKYHKKLHYIYAKDTNSHLIHCEETLTKTFNNIITNQWTENSIAKFLNTNIVIQCINQAINYGFNHPLFAPRILLQCISTNEKTKELWNRCKHRYIENSITNELKDLHIIDMYQETVQNNISTRSIQPLLKELKACVQNQDKAAIYAERKMAILKKLLQSYNYSQIGETDDNNSILSTLLEAIPLIKSGAKGSFSHFIDQDKLEERTLPWNFNVLGGSHILEEYMDKLHESIIALAKQTDKFVEMMNATHSMNNHSKPNSAANSQSNSKGNSTTSIKQHQKTTDEEGNCTYKFCTRNKFVKHKPGAIPGCGRICKLKQKGIKCSTPDDETQTLFGHFFTANCNKCLQRSKDIPKEIEESTNSSNLRLTDS